jgi:hypothetical protein
MSGVSTSTAPGGGPGVAERMGIKPDALVMEIGYGDDADESVRQAIEAQTGEELVDEDSDEVVDMVLLWYRVDEHVGEITIVGAIPQQHHVDHLVGVLIDELLPRLRLDRLPHRLVDVVGIPDLHHDHLGPQPQAICATGTVPGGGAGTHA